MSKRQTLGRSGSWILAALWLVSSLAIAQVHRTDEIEVELVAETTHAVPGQTLWLGIRLDPIEHWHTYWKFGGDSGEATEASNWQLPPGATVGEIQWPLPQWTPFEGTDLVTFAYEHEVLLPIPVTVPADYTGTTFDLRTRIDWQVCDEICIPGDAEFALSLPVAASAAPDPRWQQAFADARSAMPRTEHELVTRFNTHGGQVNLMVAGQNDIFAGADDVFFFPEQDRIMKFAPLRDVMLEENRVQVTVAQHRRLDPALSGFSGVLAMVDEDGRWLSWQVEAERTDVAWRDRISVELLAETAQLVPGEAAWLGIRLTAAEGWHTYWKHAGDSGEPTQALDWQAPEGTRIGAIQWPIPHWLPFPGSNLANYGYEGAVVLPMQIALPADFTGEQVTVSTRIQWYVCELICIPGEQRMDLTLPVGEVAERDARHEGAIAAARAELPTTDHDIQFVIAAAGERVSLGFQSSGTPFEGVTDAWFFPDRRYVIANGPLRDVTLQPNMIQITHTKPRILLDDLSVVQGTLVVEYGDGRRQGFDFVDPAADANQVSLIPLAAGTSEGSAGGGDPLTWVALVGFMAAALAGGLILNLMPCVFPVLSLKALTFAANAGASHEKQRLDGLVYTAGVVTTFLVLASILIALRAGGAAVGWAFQLQSPWVIALLVFLFFAMGLSLSGLFEIGVGLMNVGTGRVAQSHGYQRSFFTGVLAVLVASPCTAPFMGPALGFALTQTWLVAMAVFFALGLGMALPILVLSFLPALARYMPRPGNWMVTFKEFMAFPMYSTALWLLWVLGNQVGVMGMALVLGGCILLAFGVWLLRHRPTASATWRYATTAMAVLCLLGTLSILRTPFMTPVPRGGDAEGVADGATAGSFEPFSTARLEALRADGKPVLINMTAAWCITCLANEQTTFSSDRVQQAMVDKGITYLKGDWTNEDPEITAILDAYKRPSVPLYLLYPADSAAEAEILPQILTPGILLEAFERI